MNPLLRRRSTPSAPLVLQPDAPEPFGDQPERPGPFWAKITGQAAGTNRYSFEEIDESDTAAFDVGLSAGFAQAGGTATTASPAYEINGLQTVPTGTRVKLWPAGDLSYYVFEYAPASAATPTVWKQPVIRMTTGNITLSGSQLVDGTSTVAGERILVANQTTQSQNGIYVASASTWTRASDAATATDLAGATVGVLSGSTQARTIWTCTPGPPPFTVGTAAIPWKFVGPPEATWTNVSTGTAFAADDTYYTQSSIAVAIPRAGTWLITLTVGIEGQISSGAPGHIDAGLYNLTDGTAIGGERRWSVPVVTGSQVFGLLTFTAVVTVTGGKGITVRGKRLSGPAWTYAGFVDTSGSGATSATCQRVG